MRNVGILLVSIPVRVESLRRVYGVEKWIARKFSLYPVTSGLGFGYRDLDYEVPPARAEELVKAVSDFLTKRGYTVGERADRGRALVFFEPPKKLKRRSPHAYN